MDGEEQVAAYTEAGRIDGVMAAAYLFHSARISQVIRDCETVVDLGCGPATQLAQVAELNPATAFTGLDLSEGMLERARAYVRQKGLANVEFASADMTRLEGFGDGSVDGVISTMALHHLPTFDHLRACLREVRRILKPNGAVYLVDFGRLKSLKSVLFFAYMNRDHQPHIFSLDYERSLRAAFLPEELEDLSCQEMPAHVRVYTPFGLPLLSLIKSPDRPLDEAKRRRLGEMRRNLPTRYRRDLDDIRLFFWLGGLRNDPFRERVTKRSTGLRSTNPTTAA